MQIHNSFSHPAMEAERSGWFECSCCPTNLTRLLPSIPGYVYAQNSNNVYVNLFINSSTDMSVEGKKVSITQENNYPWGGDLKFKINPASSFNFSLMVRIPGWARNEEIPSDLYSFKNSSAAKPVVTINGEPVTYTMQNGYAMINRNWKKNDLVEVKLPMEVQRIVANAKVKNNVGRVALQRGPLVYCAEWVDNNGKASNLILPSEAPFTTEYKADLLNGVVVIKSNVPAILLDSKGENITTTRQPFFAIPYYAWANRGKGEMQVWFPEKIKDVEIVAKK